MVICAIKNYQLLFLTGTFALAGTVFSLLNKLVFVFVVVVAAILLVEDTLDFVPLLPGAELGGFTPDDEFEPALWPVGLFGFVGIGCPVFVGM